MFSLIHGRSFDVITREGITLFIALLIAEWFYKFHSFTLECAAFLVTWYVLGAVAGRLSGRGD